MERLGVHEVADAVRHFSGVTVKDYGGIKGIEDDFGSQFGNPAHRSDL